MRGLKTICRAKGLTQEFMARTFGVSYCTWRRWEACKSDPPAATREALADYLGVTLDQLAGRAPYHPEAAAV